MNGEICEPTAVYTAITTSVVPPYARLPTTRGSATWCVIRLAATRSRQYALGTSVNSLKAEHEHEREGGSQTATPTNLM